MFGHIAEILPPVTVFLLALYYAVALTLSKAEDPKMAFLGSLQRRVGEMPDPFYGR